MIEYGQVMQALLNTDSELRRFEADFLFQHFEIDELLRGFLQRREFGSAATRESAVSAVVAVITSTVSAALTSTGAIVMLSNFVEDGYGGLSLSDWRSEFGEREFFVSVNSSIAKRFGSEPRVQIVDLAGITANFGRSRVRDQRLYFLTRMAWHGSFLSVLADELSRHVKVSLGRTRKCLVVDLDNTLWAGVLGEEGALGVRVGTGDATSEAHFRLQQKILAMRERGILLAVCSKNNPEDVAELFRIRTDMPLRAQDFTCMQIGWERKDLGLQRIASEMNIGTDSFVFVDDDPAEIDLIKRAMPEVECILVPADLAQRAACLDRVHSLDRAIITTEDEARSSQYREGALRDAAKREFADFPGFLRSLETSIWLEPLVPGLVARAHQLFMKTNQFNVTGRRYDLAEIERSIGDPSCMTLMVRATDRFGDLGWIAAVVLRISHEPCAHIENLVISCRALGRGMEVAILNCIKSICFELNACERLTAEYRRSRKNSQASQVFEQGGFEVVNQADEAVTHYSLRRNLSVHGQCAWIEVGMPDATRLRLDEHAVNRA
jgi:FkbH-like protein